MCFGFAPRGWPSEIKNGMWLWYQLQTHVRAAFMFPESQSVYHVNVTGDWKLGELSCVLLSVKCLLGAAMCVCVCLHNCMHSSSQLCAYCAGLSVYGCTFLNYISATKLPWFPGILPSSGAASRLSQHAWVEKAACGVLFQTSHWNSTALIELLALDLSRSRRVSRGLGSKEREAEEKTNLKTSSMIN